MGGFYLSLSDRSFGGVLYVFGEIPCKNGNDLMSCATEFRFGSAQSNRYKEWAM
jgi:hypothetical protein